MIEIGERHFMRKIRHELTKGSTDIYSSILYVTFPIFLNLIFSGLALSLVSTDRMFVPDHLLDFVDTSYPLYGYRTIFSVYDIQLVARCNVHFKGHYNYLQFIACYFMNIYSRLHYAMSTIQTSMPYMCYLQNEITINKCYLCRR